MTDALVAVPPELGSPQLLPVARQALAEAEDVRSIRRLADEASVMRTLVRKAEKGRAAQNEWAEFRLDAERKGGGVLRDLLESGERAASGQHGEGISAGNTSTLVDLGVGSTANVANIRASRWQQLALIPDEPWAQWKAEQRTNDRDITEAAALTFAKRFREWTERERELFKRLLEGETVVLSYRIDANLIEWTEEEGLFVRIDRRSDWGNPFLMDDEDGPNDGDRPTVITLYEEHYLPFKPSLTKRLAELRGKALGCWCAPDPCHGEVLKDWAESRGKDGDES